MKKICTGCGEPFETEILEKKFCTKSCGRKAKKTRDRQKPKEFRCAVCKKLFIGPTGSTVKKFCSLECRRVAIPPTLQNTKCLNCGLTIPETYRGRKYCSRECRPAKSKVEKQCPRCLKSFQSKETRKYCSKQCQVGDRSLVYFLLGTKTNRLKVGITGFFYKRLDGMRRQNCDDLVVLGTIPGDLQLEQQIHKELEASRTHYEFYEYDEQTKAAVERILSSEI